MSPCRWVTEEVSSKTHKVKLDLREAVLDIDLIRGAEKAPVLKQFLASQLNKWKIKRQNRLPIPVVSDRGSNIVKAIKESPSFMWVPCMSHVM